MEKKVKMFFKNILAIKPVLTGFILRTFAKAGEKPVKMIKNISYNSKARIIAVLMLLSTLSCLLLSVRIFYSHHFFYLFLVWNLFLALIPLGIAYKLYRISEQKKGHYFLMLAIGALWLLFFPNSPYIVTDFIHLEKLHNIPLWFDAILIFSFATTGLLSGLMSLYFIHEIVKKIFSQTYSWLIVMFMSLLGGYGVYMGRVLRWNSWDIFVRPRTLVVDSVLKMNNFTAIGMTLLFAVLLFVSYFTLWSFINLNNDKKLIKNDY